MCDLNNKVAIVTGSTSGIGKAIAQALSDSGASVMINSVSSVKKGEQFASDLSDADYCQGDVANETDCLNLIDKTLEKWGKIDILVNNAAISHRIPHHDLSANTDEVFNNLWQTNLMGTWYLCRATMPHLSKNTPGNIINISSIAGTRATGSSIPYALSKAAVNHLTKLLANQFSDEVKVNAIAPGFIETERTKDWPEVKEYFTQHTAAKKPGKPEDIAKLALGIITSDYLTGQVIECDGGFCLG